MGLFISENNVPIKKKMPRTQKAANCGERHILRRKIASALVYMHLPFS
jgi:hypothetical protein